MRILRVFGLLALVLCLVAGCKPAPQTAVSGAPAKPVPVDINSASTRELMTLPGISEVRAQAIVRARPFARTDELVQKGLVPLPVYEGIRDRVVTRRP